MFFKDCYDNPESKGNWYEKNKKQTIKAFENAMAMPKEVGHDPIQDLPKEIKGIDIFDPSNRK